MRYRPFSHFNVSVSAVSLVLEDGDGSRSADDWADLVCSALECGVNSFEVQGHRPEMIEGLARATQSVERRLLFVTWRIGPHTIPPQFAAQAFQPQMIQASVQSALARTGLGHLDLVLLDNPGERDLPPQSLSLLKELKARGAVRLIGVAGDDDAIDAYISTRQFDSLALSFNILSGWRERLRLRAAQERDMGVIGYDFYPAALRPEPVTTAKRRMWRRRRKPAAAGPYDFLAYTAGWTTAQICLAFALTEPSLATVQVKADDAADLPALCSAVDLAMPAGLAAQIEMARVDAGAEAQRQDSA